MSFNVVIPAAGAATRLRPLTSNCSKAMVRIHGKPAIAYILDELKKYDVAKIVIVDGKFDDIREYCAKEYPDVKFTKQETLNGPRDAIDRGIAVLKSTLPLVVWLGDALIFDENMPLGEDFLLTMDVENHSPWCIYDGESFYDKPDSHIENGKALVGLYSFANGNEAAYAFNVSQDYDISAALEIYGNTFKTVEATDWNDIGTIAAYHDTSAKLLSKKARAFNSFVYRNDLKAIEKIASDPSDLNAKYTIEKEKAWYKSLDPLQRMFVPKVADVENGLIMSYESGNLLSDLLLYEDLSESTIEYLVDRVVETVKNNFHSTTANVHEYSELKKNTKTMWVEKSAKRLARYKTSWDVVDDIIRIAEDSAKNTSIVGTMHGDCHFGNIIYNVYNDSLVFIDPRGEYGEMITKSGDWLYDIAKLSHDLYHGYGEMVADAKYPECVKGAFLKAIHKHYGPWNVDLINNAGILLIATCIPLHYDDPIRQKRFMTKVEEYIYETYRR